MNTQKHKGPPVARTKRVEHAETQRACGNKDETLMKRTSRTSVNNCLAKHKERGWCFTAKADLLLNVALRPQKPSGSLGTGAQDGHLDFHTVPELWKEAAYKTSLWYRCTLWTQPWNTRRHSEASGWKEKERKPTTNRNTTNSIKTN